MINHPQNISAHEVLNFLIPGINVVEQQIEAAFVRFSEMSNDGGQQAHYGKLQMELQLELTMIRMNLQHLLHRYQCELEAAMNDQYKDILLSLDKNEVIGIECAKQLYQRVQILQNCA